MKPLFRCRTGLLSLFLLGLVCNARGDRAEFKQLNLGDRTVTNAYVSSETPVELVVMWDGGGKTFKRAELPPALKERYPYDARKAEAYLKQQEIERAKRLAQAQVKQQQMNQELKSTLLGQRQSLKQRVAVLDREVSQVHNQIDNRRPRIRRRLSAAEQADQERLTRRQSELRDQIDDLNSKIAGIDLRLAAIP